MYAFILFLETLPAQLQLLPAGGRHFDLARDLGYGYVGPRLPGGSQGVLRPGEVHRPPARPAPHQVPGAGSQDTRHGQPLPLQEQHHPNCLY